MENRPTSTFTAAFVSACALLGVGALVFVVGPAVLRNLLLGAAGMYMVYLACRGRFALYDEARRSARRMDNAQLARVYRATTEALASAIAAKDSYTCRDPFRVQRICELISQKLEIDEYEVEGICIAALLRDVGKLGIPDHILLKPGPLDPDEFSRIRNHAAIGAGVLEEVDYPWDVVRMVRHHHERYDGTGYPDQLAGDQIPLGSRIISVAEVYDALISERYYRKGWSHQQAVDHIERLSGAHFDPLVVKAFLALEPEIAALSQPRRTESEPESSDVGPSFAAADMIAQANRELVSLFEIARTLSSTLEIDEVVALLAQRTRRLIQADACVVFTVDEPGSREMVARSATGRHQEVFGASRVRLGKGMTGKAAYRVVPCRGNYDPNDLILAPDADSSPDFKSCAVAPIVSFGELLGTINIYDLCANAFSDDDLRTLTFVAQQAALAIENASAFERIRDTAMRDSLTNLYNRRYLRSYLEREISRASRLGEQVSVLGLDLDNFKAVNDLLGHYVGDAVLKSVGHILRRHLRDYDIAVRSGGDEFVVVLPGTPECEAAHIGRRIQQEIERYAQQTIGVQVAGFGASVGVASFPGDAGDLETLLAKADAAMYRDKRARKQGQLAA